MDRARARNEVLFREVNERLEVGQKDGEPLEFLCECGDIDCTLTIPMTRAEYEVVRSDPTTFSVAPGHQREGEAVVHRGERFNIMKKLDDEAAAAKRTDPRKR